MNVLTAVVAVFVVQTQAPDAGPSLRLLTVTPDLGLECEIDGQELTGAPLQSLTLKSLVPVLRCRRSGERSSFITDAGVALLPKDGGFEGSVDGTTVRISANSPVQRGANGGTLLSIAAPVQVTLSLTELPPSRVQCSLERLARYNAAPGKGLSQHQVEWDPKGSLSVSRTVELTEGQWSTLCRADPRPGTTSGAPAWTFKANTNCTTDGCLDIVGASDAGAQLLMTAAALPTLSAAKAGLRNLQATSVTRSTGAMLDFVATDLAQLLAEIAYTKARGRAADLLKRRLLVDLCEGSLSTHSEFGRLLLPVSFREAGSRPLLPATCDAVSSLSLEDLAGAGRSLVLALRQDAVALSFAMLADHLTDAVVSGVGGVSDASRRALATLIRTTSQLVADQLSGLRAANVRDAQLVLISLAQIEFSKAEKPTSGECMVDLGLAIAAQCHDHGGCDAADVAQRTINYEQNFTSRACSEPLKTLFAVSSEERGRVQRFVLKALELADPPHDATNVTMLKTSADLVFSAVELLLPRLPAGDDATLRTYALLDTVEECRDVHTTRFLPDDGGVSLDQLKDGVPAGCKKALVASSAPAMPSTDRVALVHNLRFVTEASRALVTALVDNDAQSAVAGISRLLSCAADWNSGDAGLSGSTGCKPVGSGTNVENIGRAVERATPFLAALGGYAAALPAKDAPDHAANREARAKAIESFIDASTRREARGRDGIISVGALVGPGAFANLEKAPQGASALIPIALTMPMGIAADWLPSGKCENCKPCYWLGAKLGLHFQASFLDLAQFLTVREDGSVLAAKPEWSNAFVFAAQAGVLIGYPDTNVTIAADFRWTPAVYSPTPVPAQPDSPVAPVGAKVGLARFGVVIGVYVPFFDFN